MSHLDPPLASSDPLTHAVIERDRGVLELVENALDNDRGLLAYQPIVQVQNPGRPALFEGLIRICDPTGRIIPAKDFIDQVEAHELGRRIDCLALKLGLETLAKVPSIRLSINMSAKSIGYKPWNRILYRALRRAPEIGQRLILEITERTAIVMPELVQSFMSDLQDKGVAFALDDFGSGYTALRYLRDFYFDILKIDGEFIKGVDKNPDNRALVSAMVSMAQHFDMLTIAEFVETAQEAEVLAQIGVDCLQGYYYGLPTTRPFWDLENRASA